MPPLHTLGAGDQLRKQQQDAEADHENTQPADGGEAFLATQLADQGNKQGHGPWQEHRRV